MNLVKYQNRTGTSNTVISSKFNFGFGTGSGSLLDIGLFRLSVPVLVLFPGGNNRRNDTNVLEENTQTLQDLVKFLTLKISADEIDKKNDAKLVVENFAKIIP